MKIKKETNNNIKNENWWNENTMSYKSWDLRENERGQNDAKSIENVNREYISNNTYLSGFFKIKNSEKNNNISKFENVLDIGCGWGSSSILLSEIYNHVYAIDISLVSVKNAKKNIELNNKKNITLEKLDAENLDYNNFFDFVYSWGAIHHSINPSKVYSNMFKSLKNNGEFMIMVYNKISLRYWVKGFYQLFVKLKIFKGYNFESVQKFFTDGYYHKHYNPIKLIDELKEIGFKDLNYQLTHMNKSYVPFLKKNSYLDNLLKKKFGWLLIVAGRK